MSDSVRATGYLIIKAERNRYGTNDPTTGLKSVIDAKISGVRQGRPARMERDEILVKVTLELPKKAFDPISPSALIVVGEEMILDRSVIEAEVSEDEGSLLGYADDGSEVRTVKKPPLGPRPDFGGNQ